MWAGKAGLNSWALQSQKYQNMKHEEVDWTLLAKQWIQLKESNDSAPPATLAAAELLQSMQPPPPPPMPPTTYANTAESLQPPGVAQVVESAGNVENAGAVDMEVDMEEDKESYTQQYHNNGDAWKSWNYNAGENWENNEVNSNWGYNYQMGNSRPGPPGAQSSNLPHGQISKDVSHPGFAPCYNQLPNAGFSNYEISGLPSQTSNYWGSQHVASSSGVMMQKVVDYGHKDRKTFPRSSFPDTNAINESELDATQRKQLPAWIRDGLEKMERERLKINEQERMQKTQREMFLKKKEAEENARKLLQECDDGTPKPPVKSKFDSDSDNSDVPDEDRHMSATSKDLIVERISNDHYYKEEEGNGLDEVLTEEEKMLLTMSILKTSMTEILIDITSELIGDTCFEVFGKAKMKAQQLKKSPALGMLTGGLGGLDVYSDSGAESNADDDEEAVVNSDEELLQTIKRKRHNFEDVERDIFRKLQKEEEDKRADNAVHADSLVSTPESSSQEVVSPVVEDQDSKDSTSGNAQVPEVICGQQSTNESGSNYDESDSKSSSSYVKKSKKKKKAKSRRDSSDTSDHRRSRKKKKKSYDRSRSRSRSRRVKSRSRSVKRKPYRNSRSRSRSTISKRRRRSRSRSRVDKSRHKRDRRSTSRRHHRRSRSRDKYGGRYRRSNSTSYRRSNSRRRRSRSRSRRKRRSRSVEIKERSKRRSRS